MNKDSKLLPDNIITLKEIYERLIQLEAKFDLMAQVNKTTVGYFKLLAFVTIFLQILIVGLHIYMIFT